MTRRMLGVLLTAVLVISCDASGVSPSPSSPTSPIPTRTLVSSPTLGPSLPQSAEGAADTLAIALESSDFTRLEALMGDGRWTVGFQQGESLPSMPASDAVRWLRNQSGGTLTVSVQRRPLFPTDAFMPPGQYYVNSSWKNIAGSPARKGLLVLRQGSRGWEWSGVIFAPP